MWYHIHDHIWKRPLNIFIIICISQKYHIGALSFKSIRVSFHPSDYQSIINYKLPCYLEYSFYWQLQTVLKLMRRSSKSDHFWWRKKKKAFLYRQEKWLRKLSDNFKDLVFLKVTTGGTCRFIFSFRDTTHRRPHKLTCSMYTSEGNKCKHCA